MPLRTLFLLLLFTIFPALSQAQELFQDIRGKVTASNGQPVPGATVMLINAGQLTTVTDSSGQFRLMRVPVGRHTVKVTQLGYGDIVLTGLVVDAGKETILEVSMEEGSHSMQEVEVNAASGFDHRPNTKTFTVEETKRFAATFYDPARLATSFPGVVSDNDQANNIVIRGNSPNGLLWRLEGIDIVNPNHLDNAGTFSDRATVNGGGVNILSAQLLDNSQLITGAFGAEYGNALSGVLDIHLRKGNNQRNEFTGQVSLLGTDIAAEGPFTKNRNSSYLVNYRYSTIGLLSAMGLDLGDEITTFQDLSFNLSFPAEKAGNFTLFGIGGLSSTLFHAQKDSTAWEYNRDRYDVDFYSKMGAVGLTHSIPLSSKLHLRTSAGVSSKLVERTGSWIADDYSTHTLQQDHHSQSKVSLHSRLSYSISARNVLTAGINANEVLYDVSLVDGSETRAPLTLFDHKGHHLLLQPYLGWKSGLTKRMILDAGFHYMYLSLNGSRSLEPRLSLLYHLPKNRSVTFAYGLHSQVQQPGIYYTSVLLPDDRITYPNRDLEFTKAHHYSAAFSSRLFTDTWLKVETYYQYLYNVPVSTVPGSTFSVLNTLEAFAAVPLVNEGTGENYGLELLLEKKLSNQYYFLFSGTAYQSTYTAADGITRNTRYNGNYAFSFSGGKEIQRSKNRVLGINLRAIYRGGYRHTPINEGFSAMMRETIYIEELAFTQQLPDYMRMDLRISMKKQKRGYTRTLALDIQNVTNTKNVAYCYYDPLKNDVVAKYQLGIIPVISYRVDFGLGRKQ